jgi:hypothetical protein
VSPGWHAPTNDTDLTLLAATDDDDDATDDDDDGDGSFRSNPWRWTRARSSRSDGGDRGGGATDDNDDEEAAVLESTLAAASAAACSVDGGLSVVAVARPELARDPASGYAAT